MIAGVDCGLRQEALQLQGTAPGLDEPLANVDLAGAFGTAVTGRPLVPHIMKNAARLANARHSRRWPRKLRRGLSDVPRTGTARRAFADTRALETLNAAGWHVYAKTGTTKVESVPATSRILTALVRWEDSDAGEIEKGYIVPPSSSSAEGPGPPRSWRRTAEFLPTLPQ